MLCKRDGREGGKRSSTRLREGDGDDDDGVDDDGKHKNRSKEGERNIHTTGEKKQMMRSKNTQKMNEGGRGERKQHSFSSAFKLACSVVIAVEVKPSTPVCVSLNKLDQAITADLRTTSAAGGGKRPFQQTRTICVSRKPAA